MNLHIDPFKKPFEKVIQIINRWDIQAWIFKDVETFFAANNRYLEFLDKEVTEIENKKICDVLDHKTSSMCYESNLKVLKNRKPQVLKQWMYNGLNENKLLLITKAPIYSEINGQTYILCTAVDITENNLLASFPSNQNREYMTIVENMEEMIIRFLPDTTITFVNKSSNKYFNKDNKKLIGKKFTELFPSNYSSEVFERIKFLTKEKPVISYEQEIVTSNKQIIWQRWTQQVFFDENGEIKEYQSVGVDITKVKNKELELKNNFNKIEQKYYKLIELSPIAIIVLNQDKIMFYNSSTANLLGVKDTDLLLGRNIYDFIDPLFQKQIKKYLTTISSKNYEDNIEGNFINIDGDSIYVQCSGVHFPYEYEEAIILVLHDITKRKKAQDTIKYMAYHDPLTGLPNKYYLKRKIKRQIENNSKKNSDSNIALIFVDLDRFKIINDTLGHSFGDIVLKIISERLESCVRENDIVTRYGGDEFIILISRYSKFFIEKSARDIINIFSSPIIVNKHKIYVSASLGISIYPEHGNNQDILIKSANLAVNIAKENGGNNYKIYEERFREKILYKANMENKLREAINSKSLLLNYQPQIKLIDNSLIGFEALVRLKDTNSHIIMPDNFINIAEETGLIIPLGEWVLKTACVQFTIWKEKYKFLKHICVNVSVRQFQYSDFVETVRQIIKETGINPSCLVLEITESIIQNIKLSQNILGQLKEIGVKIALDDFGTGYSSLSNIQKLPIDILKIDRSFISCMNTNGNSEAIIKSIIDMGRNLSIDVIAEGIEKQDDLNFLISNNCLKGQGYYYSKPVSKKETEKSLDNLIDKNEYLW